MSLPPLLPPNNSSNSGPILSLLPWIKKGVSEGNPLVFATLGVAGVGAVLAVIWLCSCCCGCGSKGSKKRGGDRRPGRKWTKTTRTSRETSATTRTVTPPRVSPKKVVSPAQNKVKQQQGVWTTGFANPHHHHHHRVQSISPISQKSTATNESFNSFGFQVTNKGSSQESQSWSWRKPSPAPSRFKPNVSHRKAPTPPLIKVVPAQQPKSLQPTNKLQATSSIYSGSGGSSSFISGAPSSSSLRISAPEPVSSLDFGLVKSKEFEVKPSVVAVAVASSTKKNSPAQFRSPVSGTGGGGGPGGPRSPQNKSQMINNTLQRKKK